MAEIILTEPVLPGLNAITNHIAFDKLRLHESLMKIEYDDEKQEVTIDGVRFDGRIWDYRCDQCGGAIIFYESYDADFCPTCNKWTTNGLGELPPTPMPLQTYNLK